MGVGTPQSKPSGVALSSHILVEETCKILENDALQEEVYGTVDAG